MQKNNYKLQIKFSLIDFYFILKDKSHFSLHSNLHFILEWIFCHFQIK